jgi:hypothetical protein
MGEFAPDSLRHDRDICVPPLHPLCICTRTAGDPRWDVKATVDVFPRLEDVPIGYWPIIVMDDIQTPGAAGVHEDKNGQPFALVTSSDHLEGWSLTASHERKDCRKLSARFLEDLLTRAPWREAVPFAGVWIKGARIVEDVDRSIEIFDSRIEGAINLRYGQTARSCSMARGWLATSTPMAFMPRAICSCAIMRSSRVT